NTDQAKEEPVWELSSGELQNKQNPPAPLERNPQLEWDFRIGKNGVIEQKRKLLAMRQTSKLARSSLMPAQRRSISIRRTSSIILCGRSRLTASHGFIGGKICRAHWKRLAQRSVTQLLSAAWPVSRSPLSRFRTRRTGQNRWFGSIPSVIVGRSIIMGLAGRRSS